MDKSPRLLLSMVDCCNNFIDTSFDEYVEESFLPQVAKVMKKNYRKLFLETQGAIVVSSSLPGQFSWAWVRRGSCFTLAFFESLKREVRHPKGACWPVILEKAGEKVKNLQTPQYLIIQ